MGVSVVTTERLVLGGKVLTLAASFVLSVLGILQHRQTPNAAVARNKSNVYQDRDGVAFSESSLSQRTGRLLWNTCLVVCAILGTGFATLQAYLLMRYDQGQENLKLRNLIQVGTWICFLLHSYALAGESTTPRRHSMARSTTICCVPVLFLLYLEAHYGQKRIHGSDMNTRLTVAQAVVCIAIFGLGISLRRRPDVFVDTKMVDREYTCSLISQWTFSWPGYLLSFINEKDGITLDDLPVLGFENRAKFLLTKFAHARDRISNRMSSCASLRRILMLANVKQVTLQFILTVLLGFVMFTPHFALMRLLQLLEPDYEALPDRTDLWVWIIAFGLLTSCFSFLENWVHWICQNKVAIRIQEQLTIMIYDKSMRLGGLSTVPGDGGETTRQGGKPTNTQNMTNLIAVDAHRISKCAAILPRVTTVPLRIVVACCILGHLLGWESFLAMAAILITMVPLKLWCFRKYMAPEGDLMSQRDRRTSAVNEALRGIRQLKISAMEQKLEQKIDILRTVELHTQGRAFTLATVGVCIELLGSLMLSASALAIHAVFHGNLKSSVAFTALAILGSIDMILFSLPELIIEVLDAVVSLRRMDRFFQRDEQVMQHIASDKISFENATVTWKQEYSLKDPSYKDRWTLNGLSLDFPSHGLTVITGPTGSGKSLLLAAILGECDIIKGTIKAPRMTAPVSQVESLETEDEWIQPRSMAYASQDPWIEATSIRANILFGLPFSGQRYHRVLFECALLQDLESLPYGDLTEVGNDGVNLSGGQKWRIALARVLYSRAGILILDDIFSAVDVHTSRHIYEHALTGGLAAGRTRVLVTHHLGLCLPTVEYIIHLQGGEAQYVGSVTELERMGVLDSLLGLERLCSPRKAEYYEHRAPTVELEQDPSLVHEGSSAITEGDKVGMQNVISEESRQQGAIKLSHVQHYIRQCGQWRSLFCVIACYFAYSGLLLARNWWVKLWSDNEHVSSSGYLHQVYAFRHQSVRSNGIDSRTALFVSTYLALSSVAWVVGSMRGYILLMASLKASRAMFQELLAAVLRAPLRWIDTTPTGRIMNRFTSDFDMLDAYLGHDITELLVSFMDCMVVLLPSTFASPGLATVAIALLLLCVWYSRQYLIMAREMKRLESVARSPIYDQMGSSINGLWTIRAFGRTQEYIDRMQTNVDYHARALWQLWLLSRWLGFRMNMIGTLFCVVTAATVVFLGDADAALAGFVLGFTIQLTHSMTKAILAYACFELDMNGVERVLDYTEIETEPSGGRDPPAAWPIEGRIEVSDLVVSYAPDMPPVIKGLNFQVESHQRVGVVGRTGAGKSSLALSLFRLLEAKEGQILVDGIDISSIKLHHLRNRLVIIPQDPILFSGTIRSNLDPFGERTDNELVHVLNEVHWCTTTQTPALDILRGIGDDCAEGAPVTHLDSSALDEPVSELGANMSQGQRQLLCLARAAVSKPKVLVLDEATSAVDKHTDRLIQDSLKSSFHNTSTLLVIAHRLSTIVDYDRVLVLDAGQAVEFGHPADLMEIKGGAFRCMIDEDPERDAIKERITRNSV